MEKHIYIFHETYACYEPPHAQTDITVHTFKQAADAIQDYLKRDCLHFGEKEILFCGGWATVWMSNTNGGGPISFCSFICYKDFRSHFGEFNNQEDIQPFEKTWQQNMLE